MLEALRPKVVCDEQPIASELVWKETMGNNPEVRREAPPTQGRIPECEQITQVAKFLKHYNRRISTSVVDAQAPPHYSNW